MANRWCVARGEGANPILAEAPPFLRHTEPNFVLNLPRVPHSLPVVPPTTGANTPKKVYIKCVNIWPTRAN